MERITRNRAFVLLLAFALLLSWFSIRMFDLQVIEGGGEHGNQTTYTETIRVRASRGDLLDRNGNVMVGNRASYDLVFSNYVFSNSDDPNGELLRLLELCSAQEIEYIEHFPITKERPYEYIFDEYGDTWKSCFQAYLTFRSIDSDITAPLLMQTLRKDYEIPPQWSDQQARLVIGLRYELDLRKGSITTLPAYVFIEDAKEEDRAAILELNISGLSVEASTQREYYTKYAAHVLGYVGAMNSEEWEYYKDIDGYLMDARVGKSGFEAAFEEYLHGIDGRKEVTVDAQGNILSEIFTQVPLAGNNVETTLDLNLQVAAENALEDVMLARRNQEEGMPGRDAEGAAVVAIDVKTGQVLVCASYPTYDLATFFENYNEILKAQFQPMYNRALQASYAPGSSYKVAMTIAAIDCGFINSETLIETKGIYTEYEESQFTPTCLAYNSSLGFGNHGFLTAAEALKVSCNYFFYYLGDHIPIAVMDETAKGMGLGELTGVELFEEQGRRSNPETKKALYTGTDAYFYPADKILTAIGQSEAKFTPIQLAVYASTLANRGVRYKATFLSRVVSSDYRTLVKQNSPVVMSTLEISDEAFQTYTKGMMLVSQEGTASGTFYNYPIAVCSKTGTAQHSDASTESDHGSFICYAPANDPQIAIAVFGEKTNGGSPLAPVAKAILDVFFSVDNVGDVTTNENELT